MSEARGRKGRSQAGQGRDHVFVVLRLSLQARHVHRLLSHLHKPAAVFLQMLGRGRGIGEDAISMSRFNGERPVGYLWPFQKHPVLYFLVWNWASLASSPALLVMTVDRRFGKRSRT